MIIIIFIDEEVSVNSLSNTMCTGLHIESLNLQFCVVHCVILLKAATVISAIPCLSILARCENPFVILPDLI